MKQFQNVDCRRGAPMGRSQHGYPGEQPRQSVRLFRVRLDRGGYDDGGAYWGIGGPVWCARGRNYRDTDYQAFTRAASRRDAAEALGLTADQLTSRMDL